jgi:pSer/pThr/pTyr-binding forkhead associated (FHA) protein
MATLIVFAGPNEGNYYPLEENRLVAVGRDDQCSFQILDEKVSRRHLQIRYEDSEDKHYAVDMRSANGVFINGHRLTGDQPLKEGDIIEIGRSRIRYTLHDFPDEETAALHFKKTDEWKKGTNY